MNRTIYSLLIIVFSGNIMPEALAADPSDAVVELCFECHTGDNGSPDPMIPKLVGQNRDYLLRQIEAYKAGHRTETTMVDIATNLKDKKLINEIVDFYSSQPTMSGNPTNTPVGQDALIAKGKELYILRHCDFCHGLKGKVQNTFIPGAPIIGGQNSEYMYKTLLEMRDNERPADDFRLMRRSLFQLSSGDIDAITKYLATQ